MKKFRYEMLEQAAELYSKAKMENVLLLASQHLLEPQKRMFELFLSAGLKPENCVIAGKGYSTNQGVMDELISRGCVVAPFSSGFDPLMEFDGWFEEKIHSFIKQGISNRNLGNYRKVIVLDDGGFMHLAVNGLYGNLPNLVGIEQTSSGHHKIEREKINFPTISVARSFQKLTFESPLIAKDGCNRIMSHLAARKKDNPKILVVGLGPIGRQVASQLFFIHKRDIFATDIQLSQFHIRQQRAVQLLDIKGRIIPIEKAMKNIGEFEAIIGATGSEAFVRENLNNFHPRVSLISISSSDREFPAVQFRHKGGGIHEDYYLGTRCLVNAGFPINFDGNPHGMPPEEIELTIALLQIRVFDEASNNLPTLPYIINQVLEIWHSRNLTV